MKWVYELVNREDLVRWGREFVDEQFNNWLYSVMWYPKYQPLTGPAKYAFSKELI